MGREPGAVSDRSRQPDGGVDLDAIDRFLEKGVEGVEGPEDPVAALKVSRPDRGRVRRRASPVPPGGKGGGRACGGKPAAKRPPIPRGALRLVLGRDRMRAVLTVQPSRLPHLGFEDLMALLARAGVCSGLEEDAVFELADRLAVAEEAEFSVVVAQGVPPRPGRPVEMAIPGLGEGPVLEAELGRLRAAGDRVAALLASGRMEEIDGACGGLPFVRAGEVAVRIRPAVPGMAGVDVRGREIPVPGVDGAVPAPGEGLEASESEGGQVYVAKACGYLRVTGEAFSVISPVWVAPDEMAVYILDLCPPNGPLEPGVLLACMEQQGIRALPDATWLAGQVGASDRAGPRAVLAGMGRPPQPGQDAQVEMQVAVGSRAGKMLEDGSIDFRERNFAASVEAGALLAVVHPATAGRAGRTVRGREMAVKDGREKRLEAGDGVKAVEEEGEVRFYAQAEGCVHKRAGVLEVKPELQVPGDVDYQTGNIDFRGDLTVGGTVRGGFTVRATGDIVIGGGVENGATISAGGAVTVSKGIFGEKTRVVALGGIRAQFVQDASLLCRGEVEVGSYLYNASVRCGGQVRVYGRGEKGGIVGGEVCAKRAIRAALAGSDYGMETRLIAGVDVELSRSVQKAAQGLAFCRANVQKLMGALKVPSADRRAIGQALSQVAPSQRARMRVLARKLEELARMEKQLEAERVSLEGQQAALAREAYICVEGTVSHKVDVFIGRASRRVEDAVRGVTFRLSDAGQIKMDTNPAEGG